jgi:hypothetical protein
VSHIAVDLKVIEGLAAAVARSADVCEDRIGWGLVRLWHRTWCDKALTRNRASLAGVFGGTNIDAVISALIDFLFLELLPDGSYRVRGAARYLRLKAALSAGGKKSASNLKRGSVPGSKAGNIPSSKPGPSPALPPSTEHRAPNTTEKLAGKKPPATPDPRHAPLVKALCDAVPAYTFDGGRDGAQVKLLLAKAEPAEIVTRWRRANERSGFPLVRTLSELVDKWPHFATESPPAKGFAPPINPSSQQHTTRLVEDF